MAQASYVQSSFQSGEWSQTMQGRVDRPDYRQALSVCFNALITETEAWTRRPGTTVAGLTRGGAAAKLVRFAFREYSPYTMEFTDSFIRFWSGTQRVTTNDDQTVSSISTASPAALTTALAHGWSTNDYVVFRTLDTPDGYLLGRTFAITKTGAATFTLVDGVTGVALNGALLQTFTGGTIARVLEVATGYINSTWATLRSVQAEKQAILLNGTQPQVLTLSTEPGAAAFAGFSLAASNFKDGPYLDPYPSSLATPSAKVGNITLTFSFTAYDATVSYSIGDYVSSGGANYKSIANANLNHAPPNATYWTAVSGGDPISSTGFASADIGRHIRMFSEPALWAVGTTYAAKDVVAYNSTGIANTYWIAIAASTGVIPGTDATKWAVAAGSAYAIWSWGRITAVSGAGIISGVLAGSTNIGDMTFSGGLAGAFDGTTAKIAAAGAVSDFFSTAMLTTYVGKNYTAAGAQAIAQVTVYPSTDHGFCSDGSGSIKHVVLNLRAKATAPASSNDGTLLGTTGSFVNSTSPQTIVSNDTSTTWNYVWVEEIATFPAATTVITCIAQVVFFSPNVANGSVVTLQIAGPPLLYTTAIRIWRAGTYSDAAGWPKCGAYHEGRLWLAGALSNRFDASNSNDIFNFAPTAPDGTVTAANAINYTLNAAEVNPIFWLAPRQEGIIAGTQGGEWLIQASAANAPLTPFSIQAHQYTSLKCANIEPAQCEHTMVFVQKHKRRLMEYFADVYSGKFAAPNLLYKAAHIATRTNGIAEIRYQQDLVPVVWMRMADNSLAGITYKRDSLISKDGPTIAAAHRHTLGSSRTIESMAVGPDGAGGELEALSLITFDGNARFVEVMGQPLAEDDSLSAANYLDSAIAPTVYAANATATSLIVYGLWGLNGSPVRVVAGGLDCGTLTPSNGTLTIPFGDGISDGTGGGLFTGEFVQSFDGAMPILAGFSYTSQGQVLRAHTPQESGARQGPAFGKVRRSHRVAALLVNAITNTLSFGTNFRKMKPALFKTENGPKYTALQPFTDIYKDTLADADKSLNSQLAWQISGPCPATVAAVGPFLDTEDE